VSETTEYEDYVNGMDEEVSQAETKPQRSDSEWAQLRREAKAAKTAAEEANAAKRELAFMRAGIDSTDPKLSYFVKGYDGEIDADAIKSAAVEAGFLASALANTDPVSDPSVAANLDAASRIAAASTGATTPSTAYQAAEASIVEAFTSGGQEALIAQMRSMGLIVKDGIV
jgi:hypothetical protein